MSTKNLADDTELPKLYKLKSLSEKSHHLKVLFLC